MKEQKTKKQVSFIFSAIVQGIKKELHDKFHQNMLFSLIILRLGFSLKESFLYYNIIVLITKLSRQTINKYLTVIRPIILLISLLQSGTLVG